MIKNLIVTSLLLTGTAHATMPPQDINTQNTQRAHPLQVLNQNLPIVHVFPTINVVPESPVRKGSSHYKKIQRGEMEGFEVDENGNVWRR